MHAKEANYLCFVEDFENNPVINLLKENDFHNVFDYFEEHQRVIAVDIPDMIIFETSLYFSNRQHIKDVGKH